MEKRKLLEKFNRFIRAGQAADEPEMIEMYSKLAYHALIQYRQYHINKNLQYA
jgi:hypothetical protein